jgi:hypothetical protein
MTTIMLYDYNYVIWLQLFYMNSSMLHNYN